ncbi:MAG TPA: type II toxin-antitoxin system RelE/ParE family toxin [Gammaproteobacteria bacterium]|nr:type II toxin-antitoxin system RelE/ParE family toxin [Gammaproteobacteria bacterium]
MTVAYTLRELAQADLEKIWLYTRQEWGVEQADSYLQALFSRFDWLAENPKAGRNRDDIKTGYFCFPQGLHLVFYTIHNNKIDIIGIPHQRMDIISHL